MNSEINNPNARRHAENAKRLLAHYLFEVQGIAHPDHDFIVEVHEIVDLIIAAVLTELNSDNVTIP